MPEAPISQPACRSDSETATSLQKTDTTALEPSPLDAIALSGKKYSRRVWECIVWQTEEYVKRDFAYSIVGALIVGMLILIGGSVSASALYWAVIGFIATFIARLGKHALHAPGQIDKAVHSHLVLKQRELVLEEARNAEPKLVGRIECLNFSTDWDTADINGQETPVTGCFMMCIEVTNDSTATTTVSGFRLELVFEGITYKAERMPVKGYSVERVVEYSVLRDSMAWEELSEFPSDVEITNTRHQPGWLRFISRDLPSKTHEKKADFIMASILRLSALDRMGRPHKIYEGTWDLSHCGRIERHDQVHFA